VSHIRNCDFLHPGHTGEGLWMRMRAERALGATFNSNAFPRVRQKLVRFWQTKRYKEYQAAAYAEQLIEEERQ
jgi:hypothetical protein